MSKPTQKSALREETERRLLALTGIHPLAMPGELLRALRVHLVTSNSQLPMLPEIATRLLDMTSRANVDIGKLVSEIERDATVAGRLLAIANSAFYRRAASATSVKGAVLRLGLTETRDVIFRIVASATVFRIPEYADAARALRLHGVVTGYVCREICRVVGADPELAFLCGLLHDVGKATLLLTALKAPGNIPRPAFSEVADVIEADHAEAGALTCEYWKLPPGLIEVVRRHQSPPSDQPYTLFTAAANRITHHLGIGCEKSPITAGDVPLLKAAKVTPELLKSLLAYAERVAQEATEGE